MTFWLLVFLLFALFCAHHLLLLIEEQEFLLGRRGSYVTAGNHSIHYYCEGNVTVNKPVIFLLNGLGASSLEWSSMQPQLSRYTFVCSFDYPGVGYSEKGEGNVTAKEVVKILQQITRRLKKNELKDSVYWNPSNPLPLLLVGHSLGSVVAQLFAHQYPEQVTGMALINALNWHPELQELNDMYSIPQYPTLAMMMKAADFLGVGRLLFLYNIHPFFSAENYLKLPLGYRRYEKLRYYRGQSGVYDEVSHLPQSLFELEHEEEKKPNWWRKNLPVNLVTVGDHLKFIQRYPKHYQSLVKANTKVKEFLSTKNETHTMQGDRELVLRSILDVFDQIMV